MKKITWKNKMGYALGDIGNGLTFTLSSTFLLAFYTDVLLISGAAAGLLFLVARIWDAINDPLMGAFADKMFAKRLSKHPGKKIDKFRPYLLKGSFMVVAAAVLMFIAPKGFSMTQKLIWAYVTYICWGMCYTFVNIPYGSLAAVMTQDAKERSALSVARGLGGMVGNMVPAVIIPILLTRYAGNLQKGYLFAVTSIGVLSVISYIISYFTVEENIQHSAAETRERFSFKESFAVLKNNRPFIAIAIGSIGMLFGMMVSSGMRLYYFRENLGALEMMGILTFATIVPMIGLAPFLSKMVKRFGLKKTMSLGSLVSVILYTIPLFIPDNLYVYIVFTFLAVFFMIIPNMLIWGMVSDSIDYNQYLCGKRQEGVIYGSYSFVRKVGQALAGGVAGVGLTLIGYNPELAEQATGTLLGIKFLVMGFPAIGMLIAFIAFRYIYNLTPEKQAEVVKAINTQPDNTKPAD